MSNWGSIKLLTYQCPHLYCRKRSRHPFAWSCSTFCSGCVFGCQASAGLSISLMWRRNASSKAPFFWITYVRHAGGKEPDHRDNGNDSDHQIIKHDAPPFLIDTVPFALSSPQRLRRYYFPQQGCLLSPSSSFLIVLFEFSFFRILNYDIMCVNWPVKENPVSNRL